MDGLALLCNLHADGPLTLRRLRESGVRGLRDVEAIPEKNLASWMRASPTQARRFAEEARQLALRLVEEPLEAELTSGEPEPLEEPLHQPKSRRPLLSDRPLEVAEVRPRALAARLTVSPAPRGYEREPARTAPDEPLNSGTPIASVRIEGLDPGSREHLIGQGVLTLEALVELAGLPLARRTGIPYTKLLDLA